MSSGGLVSALSGLKKEMSFTWIGWPGQELPEDEQKTVKDKLLKEHSCLPVFVDDELADMHYNGFSNSILWPLFHYHPGEISFDESVWEAYNSVNSLFADALTDVVQDGDLVWIQDYHLMLLPRLLRERLGSSRSNVKIGFFLHTPFPSSEIYRILPVRRQVLQGVLSSDLIGFHTYDYARHFLSSCTRILGLPTVPNGVEMEGKLVHVGTFPIGIDPAKFHDGLQRSEVIERIGELKRKFEGVKIIVGVDRLDYIKGVPQKLHAFEIFLSEHPEWVGKVVLVQVAVPSRQDVEEYQNLRMTVNELVGRINGRFGTIEATPIHFLHKSVTFDELVSLYAVSDVCLVSSTRDGMNLVSYEYIASQEEKHGVLILSEFAGAAQSLNGSVIVNPWNTADLAEGIHTAVTMPEKERSANYAKLAKYVNKYTAAFWGSNFVQDLRKVSVEADAIKALPELQSIMVLGSFRMAVEQDGTSGKRVILLDYDGTLTHTHSLPEFARPTEHIRDTLRRLAELPDTYVYVLSGRTRKHLDKWFGETGVGLSAEHGCFLKHPARKRQADRSRLTSRKKKSGTNDAEKGEEEGEEEGEEGWTRLVDSLDPSWRDTIRPLLQHYTERTPGSFMEDKEVILTWHHRNSDPEFGAWQASELRVNLEKVLCHMAVSIVEGKQTLELRPSSVDKATAVRSIFRDIQEENDGGILSPSPVDFVLCIGDGKTDEPVFQYLRDLSIPKDARHSAGEDSISGSRRKSSASTASAITSTNSSAPGSSSISASPSSGPCFFLPEEMIMTATVGKKKTEAKSYLRGIEDVQMLLRRIIEEFGAHESKD